MPATYYPAIIDRSASSFGASFPDFPGCIAAGDTFNEAAVNAEAALAFHVASMVKDGDAIPEPADFVEAIKLDQPTDVAGLMIRVDVPLRVARVLVSIDEGLLRAIDATASNRSAFFAEAAREKLGRQRGPLGDGSADWDELVRAVTAQIGDLRGSAPAEIGMAGIGSKPQARAVRKATA